MVKVKNVMHLMSLIKGFMNLWLQTEETITSFERYFVRVITPFEVVMRVARKMYNGGEMLSKRILAKSFWDRNSTICPPRTTTEFPVLTWPHVELQIVFTP